MAKEKRLRLRDRRTGELPKKLDIVEATEGDSMTGKSEKLAELNRLIREEKLKNPIRRAVAA